jgi:NCAIR mutase (PurE)-related protein
MGEKELKALFDSVKNGTLSSEDAVAQLRGLPFEDLGFAKVDHHRKLRVGIPEVIFGPGKAPEHISEIFVRLAEKGNNVLATRVTGDQFQSIQRKVPKAEYVESARAAVLRQKQEMEGKGTIAVISAGTSDLPVAEEAVLTAELMGNRVERVYDVGVAGLHRLLAHREALATARVLIVCAGMEGALPSVVGGLVGAPVIAVPTSVGYGAAFGGIAALLGMVNSCASNVTVVNIDNGFGAAYVASMINRL